MPLTSKKILVTGANGQIGRHLVKQLTGKVTLLATNKQTLDITNCQAVFATVQKFQPHIIINAAAYTQVDKAETEPEQAIAVNVNGAKHLAQAAQSIDAALLHISTDYVFDGTKQTPYTETDTPNPINVYGKSKLAGEQAVTAACKKSTIVRTSWVFSAYGNNFVKTILHLAQTQDTIQVVSDQIGGPTYAGDIAGFLVKIAGTIASGAWFDYGIYHYCSTPYVSRYEFAKIILAQASRQGVLCNISSLSSVRTGFDPTMASRPASAALDCQKATQNLGGQSSVWIAALDRCFDSMKCSYNETISRKI